MNVQYTRKNIFWSSSGSMKIKEIITDDNKTIWRCQNQLKFVVDCANWNCWILLCLIYRTGLVGINLTPFLSPFCVYFVRAILCLTIECCGRLGAFECGLKLPGATFCSGLRTTGNCSEPQFHESTAVNSQQSILGRVSASSHILTLNRWTRLVISSEEWNICTRKHICCFVSSLFGPCVKLNKGIKQIRYT